MLSAGWDDATSLWQVRTDRPGTITSRFYIMASGCLSVPKVAEIEGIESFAGPVYYTGRWPHHPVDFTGKRVAVIGTGSSAIQSIPIIAAQAASLTVFQRTPNFSIPATNGPVPADKRTAVEADRAGYRTSARWAGAGVPVARPTASALQVSDAERRARYEQEWAKGGIIELLSTFNDILLNPAANDTRAEFVRGKIRSVVTDPHTSATSVV